jgi:hypothetical protein
VEKKIQNECPSTIKCFVSGSSGSAVCVNLLGSSLGVWGFYLSHMTVGSLLRGENDVQEGSLPAFSEMGTRNKQKLSIRAAG